MSEKITLLNFENVLSPEALDLGLALLETKKGGKAKEMEPYYWELKLDGKEAAVLLDKKGSVLEAACTCAVFDESTWVDSPCMHVTALLFTLKKQFETAKTKHTADKSGKNKKAAAPKKPQDPAEALLAELDPKEIYAFVRQVLAKDKAFKSQFLMHFSEKNEGNEQKFAEIVTTAIQAIRGRRKHLQGADGAKITTALTPLYKQAAAAEAKGHFREAFAICRVFIQEIPKVMTSMETNSARLNTLYEQTLEVLSLVIRNSGTPFEFKNEIFETLLQDWRRVMVNKAEADNGDFYTQLLEASRAVKRLEALAPVLNELIAFYHGQIGANRWYSNETALRNSMITYLFDLYWKELKDQGKAEAVLLEHRNQLYFYLKLVTLKKEAKAYERAVEYLLDIRKNPRKFQDSGTMLIYNLEQRIDSELLEVYMLMDSKKEVCQTAAKLFQAGAYRDLQYYEVEKRHYDPEKWPARAAEYLRLFEKDMHTRYFSHATTYCQILLLEQQWARLKSFIFSQNDLAYWVTYGPYLKEQYPEAYLAAAPKAIEQALRQTNQSAYEDAAKVLQEMATVGNGPAIVRQLLGLLRQQYSNRRSLMAALNTVMV